MALAYESNTDLAFDTQILRDKGLEYKKIADDLRGLAQKLDNCLTELKNDGWTTPAGSAFQKMDSVNWEKNIEKYASLLDTLKSILDKAANEYDTLVSNNIELTRL